MIREKLCKYFEERGLKKVDLHHEETDLFYLGDDSSAQLVWILSNSFFSTLNKEGYLHYYNKLFNTFINRGFSHVSLLALVLSNSPKDVEVVASGTPFWVVDEAYGRIVIYENQPEDFLGIRKSLEAMVSMKTAEDIKTERFYARPGPNAYTDSTAASFQEPINKYGPNSYARKYKSGPEAFFKAKRFKENKPYVVISLIVINFILLLTTDMFGVDSLISKGANSWYAIFNNNEWYRLFTSIFLHAGIDHFIGNMIVLFAAGRILERVLGHWGFLIFYILGGLSASLGSAVYYWSVEKNQPFAFLTGTTSIGASGAIYAVVVGLLFFFLTHRDASYILGGGNIGLFVIYFGYTVFSGLTSTGIDNAAHISGAMFGGLIYLIFNCLGRGNVGDV